MKLLAINRSPRKEGNTSQALKMVMVELEKEGIETEMLNIGGAPVKECIACGMCAKNRDEKCVLTGDDVNLWIQKMKEADGILVGSPIHFSGISAVMKAFLDRAFYVSSNNGGLFRHKTGAAIAVVRRSGGIPAFDTLNRYLLYAEMVLPTSNYWNVIHGAAPGEVQQDEEGKQIARILGKNMAWLMKVVDEGKKVYQAPEREKKVRMNFIR